VWNDTRRVPVVPRWAMALFVFLSLIGAPVASRADQRSLDACMDSHTRAQELRLDGHLLESRQHLTECSAQVCPRQLKVDCLGWLEELRVQIPSVIFNVTADGLKRVDVRVIVDGKVAFERLNGRALDVDPGSHRVRVEARPFTPLERDVVVNEGDKFQVVDFPFITRPKARPAAPPQSAGVVRPVPTSTYVFLGVGAAAAVNGAAWGVASWTLRHDLEEKCAPKCAVERVNVLKQRALITDISWGVSALSIASAAAVYWLRPEHPVEGPVSVDVSWLPEGGVVGSLALRSF